MLIFIVYLTGRDGDFRRAVLEIKNEVVNANAPNIARGLAIREISGPKRQIVINVLISIKSVPSRRSL
jgi:hypothetical protein